MERHRIRGAIHDSALPLLAGLIYQLVVLRRLLRHDRAGRRAVEKARRLAQASMAAIRAAIAGSNGKGAPAPFPLHDPTLPELQAVAGIVAEAVSNAVAHAKATTVRADVRRDAGQVTVTIRDDGQGFDVAAARRQARARQSLGLRLLRERALLVGGRIRISSRRPGGTEIRVRLPSTGARGGRG